MPFSWFATLLAYATLCLISFSSQACANNLISNNQIATFFLILFLNFPGHIF